MGVAYSRLAAVRPANTNEQDLYALTTGSLIGVIHICNQDTSARTYEVAVTDAAAGNAASGEDWLAYDTSIAANTTHRIRIEGVAATATVRIKASVADKLSFVLFGALITA